MMKTPILGIDIAEDTLECALWLDEQRIARISCGNEVRGFSRMQSWLKGHGFKHALVGVESTNTFAQHLVHWLHGRGHTVYLLNPERIAQYARCCGLRNKTDAADARIIAQYVAKHHARLHAWSPPSEEQLQLRGLTRTRQQLVRQHAQLRVQMRTAHPFGRAHLQVIAEAIKQQIRLIEQQIDQLLLHTPALAEQVQRLTTIKGIGRITAAVAIAEMPPIHHDTDPRSIAAWAGLCPRRHQSGKLELPARLSRRGNSYLRDALFLPSLVARRYNPLFSRFADSLAKKGKRPGVIAGALAHKLIRIFVGLLRHHSNFDPNWSPPLSL